MNIGRTIRKLRIEKGIKAQDLARMLDVSKSYISRIEREKRRINTDLLEKIGRILEVPPSVLIGNGEDNGQGMREDIDAMKALLLEDRMLSPSFVEAAFGWLAELSFPEESVFATAGDWELKFQDATGANGGSMRSLLVNFVEALSGTLPLNPQPKTPYGRFRESTRAAIRGMPGSERNQVVRELLTLLLRNRSNWPPRVAKEPVLLDDPAAGARGCGAFRLPSIDSGTNGTDESEVEVLPGMPPLHLRAARIEDSAMSPKYEPGDVVVCTTERAARSGERAVVGLADGRWTCRIFRKRGKMVQLTPLNPLHEPLYLKPEEVLWAWPVVRSFSD